MTTLVGGTRAATCGGAYRGPRAELLHARAVALSNAADAGNAALEGSDERAVVVALAELHAAIAVATGHAPDHGNTTNKEND